MAFFKKIFKKEEDSRTKKIHKGYNLLVIKDVVKSTKDTVKISFDVPQNLKEAYTFIPGQYVNICLEINGIEERRSYSICSGSNEDLAIAVKAVHDGKVSSWANEKLNSGEQIQVSVPSGHFKLENNHQKVVAFAAGSGITPILAIAKKIEEKAGNLHLFFGNKNEENIIFKADLENLKHTKTTHYLSQETKAGFESGRMTKEVISEIIKSNLDLLKADAFFLCGPEDLILNAKEILTLFGVPKDKIHFELFTTPIHIQSETLPEESNFKGKSQVTVILDDEKISFELDSKGKTILETVSNEGYDAPYSCRGGVCCTCKAKVLEGKASMTLNYSLTDQEVADGFILTCQAHPASEKLVLSYDE